MDDGIDVSEYLRPLEMEAIARRVKARGTHHVLYSVDGRFQGFQAVFGPVLEMMDREEWLSEAEVDAGREFASCRLAFQAQTGAKSARLEAAFFAVPADGPGMSDRYWRLLGRLGKADFDIACWVYTQVDEPDNRVKAFEHRGRIGEALGRVGKALHQKDNACA